MIIYVDREYLSRCDDTIEDKAAGYTEIIVSYLLSYLINDDSEYEFEFYSEYNDKIISLTTQNVRTLFPNIFIMNYCLRDNNEKIIRQGIIIDTKNQE
jgi:hypothetical protein